MRQQGRKCEQMGRNIVSGESAGGDKSERVSKRTSWRIKALRYGILVSGVIMYIFVINTLVQQIKNDNFSKSFLRVIDTNEDGILTEKEMENFDPCSEYDDDRIKKEFKEQGSRVEISDLADQLTPKMIMNSIDGCVGNVKDLTNVNFLKNLSKGKLAASLLKGFDLNDDETISWGEYNTAQGLLNKPNPHYRAIFTFLDRNKDWKISAKELARVKPKSLPDYLKTGKRK